MSDWWGTRAKTDEWGGVSPGTGLAGFLSHPDTGSEVGDRLGVISQILMNLGSGRGGAGIGEAVAGASERSAARREKRHMTTMANRMADKLEPSNPELANMIRANPEFGLQLAGKQALMPMEFEQESKLAKMRAAAEFEQADMLAARKAEREAEQVRLRLAALGINLPNASSVPTGDIAPNNTGAGEIQATPLSTTSTVPASVPPPTEGPEAMPPTSLDGGIDWTVGLTDIPGLRETQLNLRKRHNDPELPVEDVQLFIDAATTGTVEPGQKALANIAARKERQGRVTEFATGANEMARQNQALPGINLQTPGQPELMQAGIDPTDPTIVPPNQVPQAAAYLKQAVKTGPEEYNAALKDLMTPPSGGFTMTTNPVTGEVTVTQGSATTGKPTEGNLKNTAFYERGKLSMPELLKPENVAALRDPILEAASKVPGAGNYLTQGPYQTADSAAENFLISILRPDTGATINPDESALYRRIFIPQSGDDDNRVAFKAALRHAALEGVRQNQTKEKIAETALDAWRQLDPTAPGAQPPPLPEWAAKEGVTPEAWAAHPELWFDTEDETPKP